MKKIVIVALGCLLTFGLAFAAEPSAADQKWLTAVEKMVTDGQTKVSTPSKDRVTLLQDWAGKKGYSVQVAKTETGYQVTLSRTLANK